MPKKIEDFGWFGAGWAMFKGTTDPDLFPPLNDMEAQREWLGGFGAAWVEYPDEEAITSILHGDGLGGESVDEALARKLAGMAELLAQLRLHHADRANRPLH